VGENEKEQKGAVQDKTSENKSETRDVQPVPKTHLRYWERVIFQRRAGGGGNWWVQIQHAGRREKLTLGTPVKAAAAARARDFFQMLLVNGWEKALAVLPSRSGFQAPSPAQATIGDFLTELKAGADLRAGTLEDYAKALRKIVSDIFALGDGNDKCDYRGGGYQSWLEKVHAIPLAELTPGRVQNWKRTFIARAGDDPLKVRTAKSSVNSFLRRARSLFAPKTVKHLSSVKLPSPLPFDGIAFEPRQSAPYRSTFNAALLLKAAHQELAEPEPAMFLVVLLGLCAGLRKGEIDLLPWEGVKFDSGQIRIEPTRHFEPKTEHSIGDVPLDPEILEILRTFKARAKSPFVVPSRLPPGPTATYNYYRCEPVFDRVTAWLKQHGVSARMPLHTLRKEYGSLINAKYDLVTAKECLRHSSVAITAAVYVENRKRGTTGLGAVLAGKRIHKGKGRKSEQVFLPTLKNTEPDLTREDSHMSEIEDQIRFLQQPTPEFPAWSSSSQKPWPPPRTPTWSGARRTRTSTPSSPTGSPRKAPGKNGRDGSTVTSPSAHSSTGR
jgi:integrase